MMSLLGPIVRRFRFRLRTILSAVVVLSFVLSQYAHYRDRYEREEAVLNFLASGPAHDYSEDRRINYLMTTEVYRRKTPQFAVRRETLPWWCNPRLIPIGRRWFQSTRSLIIPERNAEFAENVWRYGDPQGYAEVERKWHDFYRHAARLPELQYFRPGPFFDDADLGLLKDHGALRFLDLRFTRVTPGGLETLLHDFSRLEYLLVSQLSHQRLRWSPAADSMYAENLVSCDQGQPSAAAASEAQSIGLQRAYESAFERLRTRAGLRVCIARRPEWDETMRYYPGPGGAIERSPRDPEVVWSAADRATLEAIRAEEPEAVFYDFR
jgi:hypothetical protein